MYISTKTLKDIANEKVDWRYDVKYDSSPIVLLTLGNGTHKGGFGNPPTSAYPDSIGTKVTPNNTGANLFCAALGTASDHSSNLRIETGKLEESEAEAKISFGTVFSSNFPSVFLTLQNTESFTGSFGNPPSVELLSPDQASILRNNTGATIHWVAIGEGPNPNQDELLIQSHVKLCDENQPFTWNFNTSYSEAPTVILSLQFGSYTGSFGSPAQITNLTPSSVTINPNNYGCIVNCIAFGE